METKLTLNFDQDVIEKAKELLAETDLSMKEICGNIGYSDPNYFSRAFKKNVGVTPTEYKESK